MLLVQDEQTVLAVKCQRNNGFASTQLLLIRPGYFLSGICHSF